MPAGAPPQAGTFVVDGLLEGPLLGSSETRSKLQAWVRAAHQGGYRFALEVDGDTFGLLGDGKAHAAPAPAGDVAEPLRDLLQQLVDAWPAEGRARLLSTVRSVQYRDDEETQTVYVITPDGLVDAQQRTVEAITAKAQAPVTGKEVLRSALVGLVVLAALFGITSLFVDWGAMFGSLGERILPFDATTVKADAGPFAPYVSVDGMEAHTTRGGSRLRVTLRRGEAFPRTPAEAERAMDLSSGGLVQREVLRALASGYVKVALFDEDGAHLGTVLAWVGDLREKDTADVVVPFSRDRPPAALRLAW